MGLSTFVKALNDTRFRGADRLAMLAIGDNNGGVDADHIVKWANISLAEAEALIERHIAAGIFVRWSDGIFCPELVEYYETKPRDKTGDISPKTRAAVFRRDGEKCRYCGSVEGPFHVDHVLPKSRGGTGKIENLVVACAPCNVSKKARTPEEMGWSL